MLLNNLVQNGLRYAKSTVAVTLAQDGNRITLSVNDDGPGIPESQRQNVLAPFTRAAEADKGGGHGLGLAIVNRIAQWHGAVVQIDVSPELKGARVRTFFKAY